MGKSTKRKPKVDPIARRAKELGIAHQAANDRFELHDVVNHSDADHRDMVRAIGYDTADTNDARRTLRRKPKIDELVTRKVINREEAAACAWYARMHAARYDTTGVTPNYNGAGGRSSTNFDHLPKTRQQQEAYEHFEYARAGINPFVVGMFERVVLHGRPLGKLGITFRTAARQLLDRIEGRVQL